jgi:preprotein translocase subunit SecA
MGLKEGEVIQHSMVSKSIERAQKKVEENNFGTRKRLLEYDDVMNNQREVIYKRRYHALFGERLQTDIANMVYDSLSNLIETFQLNKDFEGFKLDLYRVFGMDTEISAAEFDKSSIQDLSEKIYKEALVFYKRKNERIAESAYPVIKQVFEQQNSYQNIVVPFTDGVKQLQVVTDLPHAYETKGKGLIEDFEKNIALAIIDDVWKEHLRDLDDLRQSVQGAVYEQKDPLLIYKFESFELFKAMVDRSNKEIISFLFKGNLPAPDPSQMRRAPIRQQSDMSNLQTSRPGAEEEIGGGEANPTQAPRVKQVVNEGRDYGRNEVVSIRKIATGEQKTLKYKQAQPLVASGQWMIEN